MATSSAALFLGNAAIRQLDGLFSLNDLHHAAGGAERHTPFRFMRLGSTKALIAELANSPEMVNGETPEMVSGVFRLVKGSVNPGTYACRELVIAYAAWISAAFHLKVIRVFLGQVSPAPQQSAPAVLQPLSVEQIHGALDAANAAADQVQRAVLKSILDGSADNWKRSRWAVSFVADSAQGAPALVLPIPVGAILGTANDLARSIERNGRSFEEVLTLFDACNRYLHNEAARIAKMHRLPDARQQQEMIR